MKSWSFIEEFIQTNNLEVEIAAVSGWDEGDNLPLMNDEIYDTENKSGSQTQGRRIVGLCFRPSLGGLPYPRSRSLVCCRYPSNTTHHKLLSDGLISTWTESTPICNNASFLNSQAISDICRLKLRRPPLPRCKMCCTRSLRTNKK